MSIFDIFLKRKKKSFKTSKKSSNNSLTLEENLRQLLDSSNDPVVEMFKSIEQYTKLKNNLIKKGELDDLELSEGDMFAIIDDFITCTLDVLPKGVVVPIVTKFTLNDIQQTLLIGRDLMCVGQFAISNGTKLKHGLRKQDKLAIFIDSIKIPFDTTSTENIRISLSEGEYLTNIISDKFLEEQWSVCRFSTIEMKFSDWEKSHTYIKQLQSKSDLHRLVQYLPDLEKEIVNSINTFLGKKIESFSKSSKASDYSSTENSINSESGDD